LIQETFSKHGFNFGKTISVIKGKNMVFLKCKWLKMLHKTDLFIFGKRVFRKSPFFQKFKVWISFGKRGVFIFGKINPLKGGGGFSVNPPLPGDYWMLLWTRENFRPEEKEIFDTIENTMEGSFEDSN